MKLGITAALKRLFMDKKSKRHYLVGKSENWKAKQEFQIFFLKKFGLQPSQKLVDIGCGTLRGGIPIIDYLNEGNYYGVEVRKEVLDEGKKELKEENLEHKNPNLIHSEDFGALDLDAKMDVLFAFSVLIHMEDSITEKCFGFVSRNIADNGVFYANVNIGERSEGNWQGFPVVHRSMSFYEDLASKNGMSVKTLGKIGELGHNIDANRQDKQTMLEFRKN